MYDLFQHLHEDARIVIYFFKLQRVYQEDAYKEMAEHAQKVLFLPDVNQQKIDALIADLKSRPFKDGKSFFDVMKDRYDKEQLKMKEINAVNDELFRNMQTARSSTIEIALDSAKFSMESIDKYREILKDAPSDSKVFEEIQKDVHRLEKEMCNNLHINLLKEQISELQCIEAVKSRVKSRKLPLAGII